MCDDIAATVAELEVKGARFSGAVEDMGFGLGVNVEVPGAGEILLYEARHPGVRPLTRAARAAAARPRRRPSSATTSIAAP